MRSLLRVTLAAVALSVASWVAPGVGQAQTLDPQDCWSVVARHFGDDLDWANRTVERESHCNPCAFNPGQSDCGSWNPGSAKGVFQLLGHDDLIHAACPYLWPLPWQVTECNVVAARMLYDASGRAPWGG